MLKAASRGAIVLSFVLALLALAWLATDLLLAAPATLLFEELAIGFAALSPIILLFGWALRWASWHFEG